ncbi:chaperonin GroEL [Kutzneria albida]|uniref:60 kDa chaperonin n=1 Tax=Kutzneria albida DSM 43870 TaxID=1449976 RepID=W5WEW0_9PSEU|nr:chaperonin GroEL [Kutzneria albida]AHH99387.1 hypothetical protein KALB_6027 [Kutzneria albida DSM 43870]
MGRHALLVATGEYEDTRLSRLRGPEQDVTRLAALLLDPAVGAFDTVEVLRDGTDLEVRRGIEALTTNRSREDMVLLYFSCHGVTTPQRRLYFATTNTVQDRPAGSAISRSFVNEQLEDCLAAGKLLLLDCCFSGAFVEGFKAARDEVLDNHENHGYVVLTASNAYEYAYEEDTLAVESPQSSIFTDVLVQGLSTGDADLDGDGWIDSEELFKYVHDAVRVRRPDQSPRYFAYDAGPGLRVARAGVVGEPHNSAGPDLKRAATYSAAQIAVARGIRAAAEPVGRTLGPLGRRVAVIDEHGRYVELSDTALITSTLRAEDPRYELGAGYVRDLVQQVRVGAGDGAATAVVLAQAMVTRLLEAMRAGAHPIRLRRGVAQAATRACALLASMATPLATMHHVERLATSSATDGQIGTLIAQALSRVGRSGAIVVEESNDIALATREVGGIRFGSGFTSAYFITDDQRREAVLEDARVLLVADVLDRVAELVPVLEKVMQSGKPLLVIATEVVGETQSTLVVNKVRGTFKSVAVRAPGGAEHVEWLADIAAVTGAVVVASAADLAQVELDHLGTARTVVVTRDETTIVVESGQNPRLAERLSLVNWQLAQAPPEQRPQLQQRLDQLAGGVTAITVGALTQSELAERKSRTERAVLAMRTAIAEGVVAGGGVALFLAGEALSGTGLADPDETAGWAAVAAALRAPLLQNAVNGGIEAERLTTAPPTGGFDVHTESFAGGPDSGVIDSAGVLRVAVTSAAELAARFIMLG